MSLETRLLAEILAANRLEEWDDGWRDRNTGLVLRCTDSFGLGEGIEDGEREISVMGFDRLMQPVGLPR